MRYPKLKKIKSSRELVDVFRGYNHNLRIGDGEFYHTKNLTSDRYPVLSPRARRGIYATPVSPSGLVAKDSLCYVDGAKFIINDYEIDMGLSDEPKTLISMGAYVIIMPDKKYINTEKTSDRGSLEASVVTSGEVCVTLTTLSGEDYKNTVVSASAPEISADMEEDPTLIPIWIDTSDTPHSLRVYSTASESWSVVATTYVKISATGIGKPFSEGDGVSVSGIKAAPDLNVSSVIWAKGDDYIVVTGIIDATIKQTEAVTVERRMPLMDFIIESGNRLWGCRYGLSRKGEIVNEIYASALGDFKNWERFAGISTDSYAASVGSDGQFTGAVNFFGSPLFFKENCMHKVYGNYPSQYGIQDTACRGVQKGCERSLAIVNETLYYKSRSGVCAYNGSLPEEVSYAFGELSYEDARAGAVGNKYYISMRESGSDSEQYHLFVYDSAKGIWMREDDTKALCFCCCGGELYYVDESDLQIKTVKGGKTAEASAVSYEAVTGLWGVGSPDKKYISRLDIRLALEFGSRLSVYVEYDSSGEWEHLFTTDVTSLGSVSIPIRTRRCDHLRLKLRGVGEAKIFSISKTIEEGSGA